MDQTAHDKHGVAFAVGDRVRLTGGRQATVIQIIDGEAVCEFLGDPLPGAPHRFSVYPAAQRATTTRPTFAAPVAGDDLEVVQGT